MSSFKIREKSETRNQKKRTMKVRTGKDIELKS